MLKRQDALVEFVIGSVHSTTAVTYKIQMVPSISCLGGYPPIYLYLQSLLTVLFQRLLPTSKHYYIWKLKIAFLPGKCAWKLAALQSKLQSLDFLQLITRLCLLLQDTRATGSTICQLQFKDSNKKV